MKSNNGSGGASQGVPGATMSDVESTAVGSPARVSDSSVHNNLSGTERLISAVAGAILLFVLRRKLLFYLGLGGISAYLLYRSVSGHCLIYESMGIDRSEFGSGIAEGLSRTSAGEDNWYRRYAHTKPGRPGESSSATSWSEPSFDAGEYARTDQTSSESFPASDPPANW